MENKPVKKKNSFKKIKKIFRNIGRAFVEVVKEFKDSFMKMSKKVRYIIGVWGVILVILLFLIVGSNSNAKFLEKYSVMEDEMNTAAINYATKNQLYPTIDSKLRLDYDLLKDYKYLSTDYLVDDNCSGFVLVYRSEETNKYVANSYLNCNHYTTKGYNDYKE